MLIVDGNYSILSDICQSSGIKIDNIASAKSGEDASNLFLESYTRGELFGVIFIGENMLDGLTEIETAEGIRKFDVEKDPVIISVSSTYNRVECQINGMNDIFEQPFSVGALITLLGKYFRFTGVDSEQLSPRIRHKEIYDE